MRKTIKLLIFGIVFTVSGVAIADPPRLALAKRYHDKVDVSQYLVSEKLDGVRGYWDGRYLYTRNGNRIHTPPWFTRNWPEVGLDGELWMGRGRFDEVSGLVRRQVPNPNDWRSIRFMVFDLHDPEQIFSNRLERIERLVLRSGNPSLQLIEHTEVEDDVLLKVLLARVVELGGEGLMLHRKDSLYREGRSSDILKLKPLWDAEAVVVAHIPGEGKYQGMLGSLLVEGLSDSEVRGKRFLVGTGFSDRQRGAPPAIGSVVTYRYHGYTRSGVPRFASFLRVRGEVFD